MAKVQAGKLIGPEDQMLSVLSSIFGDRNVSR